MKKLITALVLLVVLVCAFSVISFAASMEVDGVIVDKTLKQAIDEAPLDGTLCTIKLLENVDFDIALSSGKTGHNVVVDLNGHTINASVNIYLRKGTYTFKNGTIIGPTSANYAIKTEKNASGVRNVTLNLENLTIVAGRCLSFNTAVSTNVANDNNYNKVTLTNVTLTPPEGSEMTTAIYLDRAEGTTIEINVYGGNYNKFFNANSSGNITKGTVHKLYQAGMLHIYGGTFNQSQVENYIDKTNYEVINNQNGTYTVKKIPVTVLENVAVSYDNGKDENTVTKRFFAALNSLDYAKAGFEIEADGYTFEIDLDTVYSLVTVDGTDYKTDDDKYILTGAIGDVPYDFAGEFDVKVYTVNFEGVKSYIN